MIHKEASYIDLAAPTEIGIEASTPFFDKWNNASFQYVGKNTFLLQMM